jgi:hypothetical protein
LSTPRVLLASLPSLFPSFLFLSSTPLPSS